MTISLKTKKDVVTEFRCAGILEAARKVFATKGFHEAKVDDIADAAGVAKGTVYLYYDSKRAPSFSMPDQSQRYSFLSFFTSRTLGGP